MSSCLDRLTDSISPALEDIKTLNNNVGDVKVQELRGKVDLLSRNIALLRVSLEYINIDLPKMDDTSLYAYAQQPASLYWACGTIKQTIASRMKPAVVTLLHTLPVNAPVEICESFVHLEQGSRILEAICKGDAISIRCGKYHDLKSRRTFIRNEIELLCIYCKKIDLTAFGNV